MCFRITSRIVFLVTALAVLGSNLAVADDPKVPTTIALADGKISLVTPDDWVKVQPKSNIVQFEFSAPKLAENEKDQAARITVMGAGGAIEANIERWYSQFEQPDKSATKDKAKVEKFEVSGQTIHWVDIPGSFKDTMGAGPFAPSKAPILRPNFRMLGAIIETKSLGMHFVKITGPSETVEKLAEGFKKMLKEMTVKS